MFRVQLLCVCALALAVARAGTVGAWAKCETIDGDCPSNCVATQNPTATIHLSDEPALVASATAVDAQL